MTNRKRILFKVDNIVMVEETRDLELTEIEKLKELVAQECDCTIDDVEVETVDSELEMSEDVDSTPDGLVFWKALCFDTIQGVYCQLQEGSDEYLDALNNGTLEQYLNFFI